MTHECESVYFSDAIPNEGLLLIRHGPKKSGFIPWNKRPSQKTEFDKCCSSPRRGWPHPQQGGHKSIERCVQTASIITQTNHWEQAVHESRLLGDPGPFVIDSKAVSDQLEGLDDQGTMDFFREHIHGTAKPGMASLAGGSSALLRELVESHTEGLVLAVSHDVIISALAAHLGLYDDEWPEPLCGLVIKFDMKDELND